MKAIVDLLRNMDEELADARKYANLAVCPKLDEQLMETYVSLGKEELNHFNRLYDQANRICVSEEGPTKVASEICSYMLERQLNEYSEIKILLDSIK